MEHIQKLLDKSDDPLDAEMTRSQSLVEDIKNLHAKYQEPESLHETLLGSQVLAFFEDNHRKAYHE